MILTDKVIEWDSDISGKPFSYPTYSFIYDVINYKEKYFFNGFSPTSGSDHLGFSERLEEWINNVDSEKEQKALFEFVLNIHFITHEDMKALFSSAYSGPIKRWLIDNKNIKFDCNLDANLETQLKSKTWYTSLTDMNLGDFYRVNHIQGIDVRPDFKTLVNLGDPRIIESYIKENGFEQIVMIEDFIGSGATFAGIVSKLASFLTNIPILFTPQIICTDGLDYIKNCLKSYKYWQIDPVLVVNKNDCIHPDLDISNHRFKQTIIEIARNFSMQFESDSDLDNWIYGFGKTGSLIVLYSNTPDNTMPIIWRKTENWNALFIRSSREGD